MILCYCNMGAIRSRCAARLLSWRGHDALAVGWQTNSNVMITSYLSEKAELILCFVEDAYYEHALSFIPKEYQSKVKRVNIGPDRWMRPDHPELEIIMKEHLDNLGF